MLPSCRLLFLNVFTSRTRLRRAENLAAVRLSAYNDLSKQPAGDLLGRLAIPLHLVGRILLIRFAQIVYLKAANAAVSGLRLQGFPDDSVRQASAVTLPGQHTD